MPRTDVVPHLLRHFHFAIISDYPIGLLKVFEVLELMGSIGNLKLIAVTTENYWHLKNLGKAGDSFNTVITKILKERKDDHCRSAPTPKTENDLYVIKRATEIVNAVRNCNCEHCNKLLSQVSNKDE